MEARPAFLSIQRSSGGQLRNLAASGALLAALPVLPSSLEEKYPKLPDFQQVSMERELNSNSMALRSSLPSNSGVVGPLFSSTSGFSSNLHFSSAAPPEKYSRKSPFISQSSNSGASMPLTHRDSRMLQSTTSSDNGSFCADLVPGILDYPVNTPVQNGQIGNNNDGGCAIATEDLSNRKEWQDWLVMNDDDSLTSNCNDFFTDNYVEDPEPKMEYRVVKPSTNVSAPQPLVLHQIPVASGESSGVLNSPCSANGAPTKPRMRWTSELHEAFVAAVNKLGGCDSESIEQPDIDQSHQTIQRNLQLQIEEHGKYLQMMFEKQCKSGDVLMKTSSLESPSAETTDEIPISPTKTESGISKLDHKESEDARVNATITMASMQVSKKSREKQKQSESEVSEDVEASSLPSKRAKSGE